MDAINERKQQRVLKVKRFFFPFTPIKTFRSLRLIFLMAILITLRLVLSFLSIKVAPFNLSISLGWVATMTLGWYFGPVVGLFCGMLTDTLTWLIHGGIWFWMYAIQEPIVAMLAGVIGSVYRIRKQNNNSKGVADLIVSQIAIVGFVVLSYLIILIYLNKDSQFSGHKKEYEQFYNIYKWVACGLLTVFLIIFEVMFSLNIKKHIKVNRNALFAFIYTSATVVLIISLFSFALGPITAVQYLKFINGGITPEPFLKYGTIFYLIPRVALESIKVPVELTAFFGVVMLFDAKIVNLLNKIECSWNAN